MKKQNGLKTAFKGFFSSIKEDLKDLFKNHTLKVVGFVISYIVPLVYILISYLEKKPESWTLPVFVWIPTIVLLLVYWSKLRSYLSIKVSNMVTENTIQKGKHAGAIIVCKTIQLLFTVAPFFLGYFIFKAIREIIGNTEVLFLLLGITIAVGGLFMLFDTIKSVTAEEEIKEEKSNE